MSKINTLYIFIIAIIVVSGISFYAGSKYAQNQAKVGVSLVNNQRAQSFGSRAGARTMGNFNGGQVISIDTKSMTIGDRNGGSKIVFFNTSTSVNKIVAGKLSDISVGSQVTVVGTPNTDGSINAENLQLRPSSFQDIRKIN